MGITRLSDQTKGGYGYLMTPSFEILLQHSDGKSDKWKRRGIALTTILILVVLSTCAAIYAAPLTTPIKHHDEITVQAYPVPTTLASTIENKDNDNSSISTTIFLTSHEDLKTNGPTSFLFSGGRTENITKGPDIAATFSGTTENNEVTNVETHLVPTTFTPTIKDNDKPNKSKNNLHNEVLPSEMVEIDTPYASLNSSTSRSSFGKASAPDKPQSTNALVLIGGRRNDGELEHTIEVLGNNTCLNLPKYAFVSQFYY